MEIIESGACGNPEGAAKYKIYRENGELVLRFSGSGGIKSYKPRDYVHVDSAPWKEYPIELVIIDEGITSVGSEALRGCKELRKLYIPKSLRKYGFSDGVFTGCDALCEVHVANLDAYAMTKMETGFSWGARYDLYVGETLVRELEVRNASSGLYRPILYSNFAGCRSLESLVLHSGYEISEGAFMHCENLRTVTLPDQLKTIKKKTFLGCSSLTQVKLSSDLEKIGDSAFSDCSSLEDIVFPEGLKRIMDYAFSGCSSICRICLPASIEYISDYAFCGCSATREITVGQGNTGYSSEGNCLYKLDGKVILRGCADSVIPATAEKISSRAFCGCEGLRTLTLPDTVKVIGSGAFSDCTSLTEIVLAGDTLPKMSGDSFDNCPNLMGFRRNDGSLISLLDILVRALSGLCGRSCPENTKRACALLRTQAYSFSFFRCTRNSLSLTEVDGKRAVVFSITVNDGTVYPDSSMPYREWDSHTYVCSIPESVSDDNAIEYALSHKSEWQHKMETNKE